MQTQGQKILHMGALGSLLALIVLCIAWEMVLAPIRPNGCLLYTSPSSRD